MTKTSYATKGDVALLKKDIGLLRDDLRVEMKKMKEFITNSEVKILGELQKMRENFDAHSFSHMRINEDMADHEKRITDLESAKA